MMISNLLRLGINGYYYVKTGKHPFGEFVKLKKMEFNNKTELEKIYDYKFKMIITHAYSYVPFYRHLFTINNLKPQDISGIKDIEKIPIISKSILRRSFPERVIAKRYIKRGMYDRTSGSTGEPFEFYKDIVTSPLNKASYKLFNTWMGIGTNEKHVHIASPKPHTKKFIIRNKIYGKYKISTLDVKKQSIKYVVDRINEIDPVYLEGYSASLDNTARLIREMNLELKVKPRAIVATSEDLTETHRKRIEDTFNSIVFNRYGSREFSGAVAQECNLFEGLHVNTNLCNVEIVDDEGRSVGEGERGHIVITDYNNFVMPFIRYDIGDSAIKGPEKGECGRVFPIIKQVRGKSEYFLISSKGEKTPIETIASHLFQEFAPNVHNFQFIHNRRGNIILKIVPTDKFVEENITDMYNYLESNLDNFSYSIQVVDEIPPSKSGKTPYFLITFPYNQYQK